MTMPKWHEIMRPVLITLDSRECASAPELRDVIFAEFQMTDEEQQERLDSGQLRIMNRLGWAVTDLGKAQFIERIPGKRGIYRITEEGRKFIAEHDAPFDAKDLMEHSEAFRTWKNDYRKAKRERARNDGIDNSAETDGNEQTPQEIMRAAERELRDALADELLERIMEQDSDFFEYLVGRLLSSMGYGSEVEVTKRTNDEGIDGIVKEDRLGFDSIYYQAKRWKVDSCVSRPEIQKFVGALSGKSAGKGLFITTARFSEGAIDYAERQNTAKIVLIDGPALTRLMIDAGVGVSTVAVYEVKAIDTDFFE